MSDYEFFVDPSRCIGCQACVNACAECDTHRGHSMIHLDYLDRAASTATVPFVCMHCEQPTCAEVCPADAIKQTEDGVVQSSLKPRCVACTNCVVACPFGIPKMPAKLEQMMKCDMCYDRTSAGKRPMCATVCPSGALAFMPRERIRAERQDVPTNEFVFGHQTVRTKVNMMVPTVTPVLTLDVLDYVWEPDGESIVTPPRPPDDKPLWRDEFSVYAADERYVGRRQFAKFLGLASLGMLAGQVWILAKSWLAAPPSYPIHVIARVNEVPVDGVKLFRYPTPSDPCILIRRDQATFVAFSQTCTHLSCAVYYAPQQRRLICPCHEGHFSVDSGRVLQGPPPRPLPRILLKRDGDDLMAIGVDQAAD